MRGQRTTSREGAPNIEIMMSLLLTIDLIRSNRVQEHFCGGNMTYPTLPYDPVEEEYRYGNAMRAKAKAVISRRCMVIGASGKAVMSSRCMVIKTSGKGGREQQVYGD